MLFYLKYCLHIIKGRKRFVTNGRNRTHDPPYNPKKAAKAQIGPQIPALVRMSLKDSKIADLESAATHNEAKMKQISSYIEGFKDYTACADVKMSTMACKIVDLESCAARDAVMKGFDV